MRVANAAAWAVVIALAVAAIVFAARLGFLGILILGLLAWLVCSRVALDEDAAGWGVAVFRARMAPPGSPEARAAIRAERQAFAAQVRFCRWCGVALTVAGAGGLVWETWR